MGEFVAMPMLKTERQIDFSKLTDALNLIKDIKLTEPPSQDGDIISFKLDDVIIASEMIGKPIPWADLEGPCQTCPFWKDVASHVKEHTAHLVTTATGENEPKVLAWYLTKGIEALLPAVDSIGVYWAGGTLVSPKDMFVDMSNESSLEYLPLYLWIDFRCEMDDKEHCSLFTTGMKSFGLMEMEIQNSTQRPKYVIDKAFNLAHYLLDKGPIVNDGDTFGMSEDEKLYVRHAKSFVDPDQMVYRLEI